MIPFTVLAAVTTVVWPLLTNQAALIGISVIYGCVKRYCLSVQSVDFFVKSFAYGTNISLVCMPLIAMGSTSDVGRRIGMFISFIGFGALAGTPISGAINAATGGFEFVGWYAGECRGFALSSPWAEVWMRWDVVAVGVFAFAGAVSSPWQTDRQVLSDLACLDVM